MELRQVLHHKITELRCRKKKMNQKLSYFIN